MNTKKLTMRDKFKACVNIILGKPVMTNVHCHVGKDVVSFIRDVENKGGVFSSIYIERDNK